MIYLLDYQKNFDLHLYFYVLKSVNNFQGISSIKLKLREDISHRFQNFVYNINCEI